VSASIPPRFRNLLLLYACLALSCRALFAYQRAEPATAEAVYRQGMKAVQSGDLKGARVAFERA